MIDKTRVMALYAGSFLPLNGVNLLQFGHALPYPAHR